MRIKALVYAAVALGVVAPATSQAMGLGNTAPVVDSVAVSPVPVPAGGAATITCAAHDTGGSVVRLTVTVSGGTLAGGATAENVVTSGATVTGTVAWSAPPVGAYTVTCTAFDGAVPSAQSAPVSISVDVVASGPPPTITGITPGASKVFPGETVQLSVAAEDPTGGTLSYAWTSSGGSLVPSGASATWTAPSTPGAFAVTVTVANANGQASASAPIEVIWSRPDGSYAAGASVFLPERLAVDANRFAYVANSRGAGIQVFTPLGQPLRTLRTGGRVSGVAVAPSGLWVTDLDRRAVDLVDRDGRRLRSLGAGEGEFDRPVDVAVSPANGRVYVADAGARAVRIYEDSGLAAASLAVPGIPVGVAVDGPGARLFVADAAAGTVRVFDMAGVQVATLGTYGAAPGQLSRVAGVAVGNDGNVYVVDALQGRVSAFRPDGVFIGLVGSAGTAAGQLAIPLGVAADPGGRLLVTSTQVGRVEAFALQGAVAPVCGPVDSDCDGLPDVWELAHGLDTLDARDAYADSDGDDLVNADELAAGTDPAAADSDGDGHPDGEEVASGFDPTNPDDHRPVLAAFGPAESPPGLVRLSSSVTVIEGDASCVYAWTQAGGGAVQLRGATTATPSFVARAAGTYVFHGVATCGPQTSLPAPVAVNVLDVPPLADGGRMTVIAAGERLVLDGAFSSDANADPVALSWEQVAGAPLTGTVAGDTLALAVDAPGVYAFQLVAEDAGAASTAEVPVLVVGKRSVPTAVVETPVSAEVGLPVLLDAARSPAPWGHPLSFAWRQLFGPAVELEDGATARPGFVPPEAGRYVFEVVVSESGVASPPARVNVFVAEAGAALPVAAAAAPASAEVGAPLTLDGSASTAGLSYAWRQLSGPAAGLTGADEAVAEIVPFAPGRHVFELTVRDGAAESIPAVVRIDVTAPGQVLPVARAKAPRSAGLKEEVRLDGRGSRGAAGAVLRYRWTQVAGPWVALEGAAAQPTFLPRLPGRYTFELEVDDGAVRSAPATVSIKVVSEKRIVAGEEDGR